MRVSLRWLRELVPDLEASTEQVAERLTASGLEVEELRHVGVGLEGVRVAEVRAIEAHPNRDKLRLVTVGLGEREQRVVCGASNVPAPGGLVAFATEGTTLPAAGVTLTERQIGGIASAGMICSEAELGLADASEGILILPPGTAAPGTPLPDAVSGCQDTIFELGITPNRPDALGHLGVARELAALFAVPFRLPEPGSPKRTTDRPIEDVVRVDNREPERCPDYAAAFVDQVTVGRSPFWMRWRLHSLGVRPISNIVDVTNWLLLEFGQPMHAFDYDLVKQQQIIVRTATQGESFTTLDGVERRLDADDLVICDGAGPTALAGVMGGHDSEIRDTTRRVLLECAYFAPRGIRRTARRHGLQTESSYRFERGVDWARIPLVLERAVVLLTELAGGAAARGTRHVRGRTHNLPRIALRSKRLEALLGVTVPFDEAQSILTRLGFEIARDEGSGTDDCVEVRGASWRPDVALEVDLIEEVARVRGLEHIPARLPAIAPQAPQLIGIERATCREAANLGLSEAVNFAFVSPNDLRSLGAAPAVVRLRNPMSEERSVMRTTLLPGLLEALRRARRRGEPAIRLFSVGVCCVAPMSDGVGTETRPRRPADAGILPSERPDFAAVIAGPRTAYLERPSEVDVYDAIGVALELIERLTARTPEIVGWDRPPKHLHPRGAARISLEGRMLGTLGPLHPDVVDALDLGGPAQVIELDLNAVEGVGRKAPQYRPIPRLPAVSRDVAIVAPETVLAQRIENSIAEAAGELCESIELFDLFRGEGIPKEQRSLAYRVVYRDPLAATDPDKARTLTDKEVDACHDRVREALSALGELRG